MIEWDFSGKAQNWPIKSYKNGKKQWLKNLIAKEEHVPNGGLPTQHVILEGNNRTEKKSFLIILSSFKDLSMS